MIRWCLLKLYSVLWLEVSRISNSRTEIIKSEWFVVYKILQGYCPNKILTGYVFSVILLWNSAAWQKILIQIHFLMSYLFILFFCPFYFHFRKCNYCIFVFNYFFDWSFFSLYFGFYSFIYKKLKNDSFHSIKCREIYSKSKHQVLDIGSPWRGFNYRFIIVWINIPIFINN